MKTEYQVYQNRISGNILNTIVDFLSFRKQQVVLNGKVSPWPIIEKGVPQGSILGPLLILIHVIYLSDDLSTNAELFADDTSLFSVVRDINTSATHFNNDLTKISNCAFQWNVSFNPNHRKQAREIIYYHKFQKTSHTSIYFNNNPVKQGLSQKHLGMIIDIKLKAEKP